MSELEENMPISFVPDLLPRDFADHFLRVFLDEAQRWRTGKRWLYDREIESHRLQSGFRYDDRGFSGRWEAAGFGDDLRQLRRIVAGAVQGARQELRRRVRGTATPSRHQLAQETVAIASRGQRLLSQSADWLMRYARDSAEKGLRWEPNYVVANLYVDGDDFLGAHSDPVGSIGPFAIVASLTLGAARQFRMKPVGSVFADKGRVTSYSIRLPHNSLLICWEGFQEFWRHEVPKDRGLHRHEIAGQQRVNFTFRKTSFEVSRRKPKCKCGRAAHFKPVLKESRNRGRYFWSCSSPRVAKGQYQSCDFFKWDDEIVAEAFAQRQPTAPGEGVRKCATPMQTPGQPRKQLAARQVPAVWRTLEPHALPIAQCGGAALEQPNRS